MDKRPLTLTLRRPLPSIEYGPLGPVDGPSLPAGATVTLPALTPGKTEIDGKDYSHMASLRATAQVVCYSLCVERGAFNPTKWFGCERFSMDPAVINVCQGDMCRCPSSRVRAEAKMMPEWRQRKHEGFDPAPTVGLPRGARRSP